MFPAVIGVLATTRQTQLTLFGSVSIAPITVFGNGTVFFSTVTSLAPINVTQSDSQTVILSTSVATAPVDVSQTSNFFILYTALTATAPLNAAGPTVVPVTDSSTQTVVYYDGTSSNDGSTNGIPFTTTGTVNYGPSYYNDLRMAPGSTLSTAMSTKLIFTGDFTIEMLFTILDESTAPPDATRGKDYFVVGLSTDVDGADRLNIHVNDSHRRNIYINKFDVSITPTLVSGFELNKRYFIRIQRSNNKVYTWLNDQLTSVVSDAGTSGTLGRGMLKIASYSNIIIDQVRVSSASRYGVVDLVDASTKDPLLNQVQLLIRPTEADGSTTFADRSPMARTPYASSGWTVGTDSRYGKVLLSSTTTPIDYKGTEFLFDTGATIDMDVWMDPTNPTFSVSLADPSIADSSGRVTYLYESGDFRASVFGTSSVTLFNLNAVAPLGTWFRLTLMRYRTGFFGSYNTFVFVNGVLRGTHNYSATLGTGDGGVRFVNIGKITNIRVTRVARYGTDTTQPVRVSNYPTVVDTEYTNFASYATITTPTPATRYDQYYRNVALLAHGTGAPGSTSIADSSYYNKSITAAGNAQINSGVASASAYFDGSGDVLSLPDNNIWAIAGDFTFEAFVFPTRSGVQMPIIAQWPGITQSYCVFIFGISSSNRVFLSYGIGGTNASVTGTSQLVVANQWNHLAVTRSGSTVRLFVNGVQDSTTGTVSGTLNNSPGYNVTIGTGVDTGIGYFQGYISNLRATIGSALYTSSFTPPTQPLTAAAQTALLTCNTTSFVDQSANNFTITRSGEVVPTQFNPFSLIANSSVYFDGVGDYISIPRSASYIPVANEDFTMEAWIYLTAVPGNSHAQIVGLYNYGIAADYLMFVGSDMKFKLYVHALGIDFVNTTVLSRNTWYHVAVSRVGTSTGNLKLFVNGVGQSFTTNSTLVGSGNYQLTIGADQNADQSFFTGYISNLRIVKGTGLYNADFAPPGTQLSAVANTTLLACHTNRLIDGSTTAATLTRVGDTQVSGWSPYVPAGAYYSTLFDGNGDYLTVPNNAAFAFGSGNFTVECWAYRLANPASNYQFAGVWVSGGYAWGLLVNSSGQVAFNINGAGLLQTAANAMPVRTWTHIAATRQGNVFSIWINGTLSVTTTSSATINASSALLAIGANQDTGFVWQYFGYMSDLRIVKGTAVYTSAFTPPTAPLTAVAGTSLLTCQSPGLVDVSSNNFAISRSGNTTPIAFSPFTITATPGVSLDGVGDYLSVAPARDFVFADDFTIEASVKITSHASGGGIIAFSNPTGGVSSGWQLIFDGANDTLTFESQGGNVTTTSPLQLNTQSHVAVTRSGTTLRIFINGVQVGSGTVSGSLGEFSTYNLYVGADRAQTQFITGVVGEVRVTQGFARYTAAFTPPTLPLYDYTIAG